MEKKNVYELSIKMLIEQYQKIFVQKERLPQWAVHKKSNPTQLVHPTIPFVGKKYFEQPIKLLVYASAENLNGYESKGYLDNDEFAINRHRNYFEQSVAANDRFFPYVHLGPIESGALTICAFHIMSKLTKLEDISPAEFLEMIAFGNYGKYTSEPIVHQYGQRVTFENSDYAGNPEKLQESQPYIITDLNILKPDYIIMIGSTYNGDGHQKSLISENSPKSKVIPIYQMFPRVINRYIKGKYTPYQLSELSQAELVWYENFNADTFTGKNKENFLCVYRYLDTKL